MEVDHFGPGVFNRARKFIWELFEEPNKSKLGKVGQPNWLLLPKELKKVYILKKQTKILFFDYTLRIQ